MSCIVYSWGLLKPEGFEHQLPMLSSHQKKLFIIFSSYIASLVSGLQSYEHILFFLALVVVLMNFQKVGLLYVTEKLSPGQKLLKTGSFRAQNIYLGRFFPLLITILGVFLTPIQMFHPHRLGVPNHIIFRTRRAACYDPVPP